MSLKALAIEITPDLKRILGNYAKDLVQLLEAGTSGMPKPVKQHVMEALDNGAKVQITTELGPQMTIVAALKDEQHQAVLFTMRTDHVIGPKREH